MPALDNLYISDIDIPRWEQRPAYYSNPLESFYLNNIRNNPVNFSICGFSAERALTLQTIHEFSMMNEGWDGYGASQIHEITCTNCKQFLSSLPDNYPFPELIPNSNGTISMEWESRHGSACLEIGKTRYSFYIKRRSGKPVLKDGDARAIGLDIAGLVVAILYPLSHYAPSITTATYKTPGITQLAC
jgi:hypothetical protein